MDRPESDGELDVTEDEIFQILFPEQFYDGPGAFTAKELTDQSGFSIATVRRRIEEKMQSGELAEVLIRRDDGPYRAWVAKSIYDEYLLSQEE